MYLYHQMAYVLFIKSGLLKSTDKTKRPRRSREVKVQVKRFWFIIIWIYQKSEIRRCILFLKKTWQHLNIDLTLFSLSFDIHLDLQTFLYSASVHKSLLVIHHERRFYVVNSIIILEMKKLELKVYINTNTYIYIYICIFIYIYIYLIYIYIYIYKDKKWSFKMSKKMKKLKNHQWKSKRQSLLHLLWYLFGQICWWH